MLVLATTDDDVRGRRRAGEALSAALLGATDLGLASCPLSAEPLPVSPRRPLDAMVTTLDSVFDG